MSSIERRFVLAVPASELPERMRGNFQPHERVRITIEADETDNWDDLIQDIQNFQRTNTYPVSSNDAVARIRMLRDEWD